MNMRSSVYVSRETIGNGKMDTDGRRIEGMEGKKGKWEGMRRIRSAAEGRQGSMRSADIGDDKKWDRWDDVGMQSIYYPCLLRNFFK